MVADDGQPLRFVTARLRASEWGPYGSQQSWWQQMHDAGNFNGVRVMSGFTACTPSCSFTAAQLQTLLDEAVANASATGMYVMIDDHDECCSNQNLTTDTSFWNAIAPRYANNTNVIYEAKNEPNYLDTTTNYGASGTGYPGYETALYAVIRRQAPNTHIVMWTAGGPYDVSQATELRWYSTASTISYVNASVGVHPYNTTSDGGCTSTTSCGPFIARLAAVQAAGYPVIMTEIVTLISNAPDQQVLAAFDGIGVSWTWFDGTGVWTLQAGPCSSANTCGNAHNEAMNIYWTVDPNGGSSSLYTVPLTITSTTTVKAIAIKAGIPDSSIGSAVYTLTSGSPTATPIFSPDSGEVFSGTQLVTLTDSTSSPTIYYYTSSPAIQIVTAVGPSLTDSSGYVWTITSGAQMAINGNVITATSRVIELVYVNGNVWQLNKLGDWYEVTSVTSPTVPTVGYGSATTTSPIPAYSTYSGPISLSASSSITAYATASGFTQSATATATYTPATRTLVSGYLRPKSGATSMTKGSTMQLIAYATYSDGTTGTLPDASGNVVTWWNTTNHKVAVISSQGHATALSQGSINMEAMVGTLRVSPWQVIVGAATPAVKAAPVSAIQASTASNTGEAAVPALQNALTALAPGPGPAAPGGPLPDTFLGPFWRIVAPAGGSASISNSHLFLGVPGGGNHDPLLPSNQAVRVVQTIGNEDFDVAVKIDSPLLATDGNTSQGLMVLSANEDFISFALTTDGTKIGLSARTVTGGAATTVLDETDFSQYQNPMYLRVTKAGSAYVTFYSVDGANWTQAASFTDTTIFTSIGPFASNYDSTPANATPVVMSVNWFDVRQ